MTGLNGRREPSQFKSFVRRYLCRRFHEQLRTVVKGQSKALRAKHCSKTSEKMNVFCN